MLVAPGAVAPHRPRSTPRLTVLASLDHAVSRRGAYLAYLGSRRAPGASCGSSAPDAIEPGGPGPGPPAPRPAAAPAARRPLRAARGRRGETVGGGEVLDVDPVLRASRAMPDRSVGRRVVAERGWVEADRLDAAHRRAPSTDARALGRCDPDRLAADRARVAARSRRPARSASTLATLDERDRAVVEHPRPASWSPAGGPGPRRRRRPARRPPVAGSPRSRAVHPARPARRSDPQRDPGAGAPGRGGRVDGVAFGAGAIERAGAVVRALLAEQPEGVTVAEIRGCAWGTTASTSSRCSAHLDRHRADRRPRRPARSPVPRL